MNNRIVLVTWMAVFFVVVFSLPSQASVKAMKVYREINKDLKPDCMYCHVDKLPKKENGKHELNEYGEEIEAKLQNEKKEMTDDELKAVYTKIFKDVGRHDNFKAQTKEEKE